jgi:hypothetical protein
MLYGAAYFTEDEWIKIDGLIHKGQYVFTRGPQDNVLEEELISFEGSIEEKAQFNVQIHANQSFDAIKADHIEVMERPIPSPTSSEPANSTDCPPETPNGTSIEASSDDEPTQTQAAGLAPMLDWASEMETSMPNEPVETPTRPTPQIPAAGGLALGYTQAQLDEVKAFNAGLTKAGKKSRPQYTKEEESYSSPESSEDVASSEQTNEDVYPSPTPSQQETRIQSWASQVKTQEPSVPQSVPPNPSKDTPQPKITSLNDPNAKAAVEAFTKIYGRKPRSIGDIYQPKNPEFVSPEKRPISRTSNATSKTARSISVSKAIVARPSTASTTTITTTTATTTKGPKPDPRLQPGKTFIAQSAFEKSSKICIDVRPGDNIKIIKHVSGIMHYGLNQNTHQTGQFPESIFTLPPGVKNKQEALLEQQRALAATKRSNQVALRNSAPSVSTSNGLDRFEGMNAAEWEDVSVVSRRAAQTPAPAKKPVGGLSASRYAVLADEDEPRAKREEETSSGISKEEVARLFDEKACSLSSNLVFPNTNKKNQFAQILAAQQANAAAANSQSLVPTGPRSNGLLKEPLKPVNPKTNTCWFWATPGKDCRFTADECRDLHAHLPVSSDPANLRMGKPTWGALADSLPPTPTDTIEYKPGKVSKTCWYWANDGKCEFSAETCKYLHGHSAAGVAPKPHTQGWKKSFDWSRLRKRDGENGYENGTESGHEEEGNGWGNLAESSAVSGGWGEYTPGEEDGELVLEEVQNDSWGNGNGSASVGWGNANGWGESSGGAGGEGWGNSDDKYKPPHIKALEEKAQIQAAGW